MINNPYYDSYLAEPDKSWGAGRDRHVFKYAWGIPDQQALDAIQTYVHNRIVEIGAGNGYWAYLLDQMGIKITAYDIEPYENQWMDGTQWFPVFRRDGTEAVRAEQAQQYKWAPFTLMMVWPFMNNMAYDALMEYTGDQLIYVGEQAGGCTASDDFFDELYDNWDEQTQVFIPQWRGIHDYLWIYTRK